MKNLKKIIACLMLFCSISLLTSCSTNNSELLQSPQSYQKDGDPADADTQKNINYAAEINCKSWQTAVAENTTEKWVPEDVTIDGETLKVKCMVLTEMHSHPGYYSGIGCVEVGGKLYAFWYNQSYPVGSGIMMGGGMAWEESTCHC